MGDLYATSYSNGDVLIDDNLNERYVIKRTILDPMAWVESFYLEDSKGNTSEWTRFSIVARGLRLEMPPNDNKGHCWGGHDWRVYNSGWTEYKYCSKCNERKQDNV